ncbi:MAG TPA: cellulase family glycosylhydrolase [Kofleriaceae bacterium]|nr:cellulase family glycosylhydrolase [Kofleriaceae bacterium]
MDEILLRVQGTQLVRGSGTPVVLRGVGLGGWMNMENFITGYPANESQQRAALRDALGDEGYRRFFDRFLATFFDDADAQFLASIGVNCVRLPFNYRHFEDDDRPFELKDDGFRILDRAIDSCARHRIYTVLDLHALPGYQNQHWHSDNPTHWAQFWTQRHFQDRTVRLWEALAERYRDNPWVAGYNPINEPADPSGQAIAPFYRRLEAAIRAVDKHHVLFLDGNRYSLDFHMFGDPMPNCVYTAHDYALPGFIDGGGYPGTTRGEYVDRAVVERTFLARTEYMRRTGTPIWIGEFGPVFFGDAARDAERYQLLRDQLALYHQHGASWSLWTYKDIGLQGLVYLPPDAPYLQRIAPVLAKKARLGVDAWGSLDTGIRHILEPIERTFRDEFPDFDPFPFGTQSWVHTLVRHILLAEPLVREFGRCFEGVSPAAAEALADGFRFDRCRVRAPLAELLREVTGAGSRGAP